MLVASLVTACAGSAPSSKARIELKPLPAELTNCADPSELPDRGLTQAEVEKFWGRDIVSLKTCKSNVRTISKHYENLQKKLGAN